MVNFNFPITLVFSDGTEISTNTLDALESTLENVIDDCDEDDDYDFDDDDNTVLLDFLTNGNWIVDEYALADEDFTNNYEGYVFNFDTNMNVVANNGTQLISGIWSIDNTSMNNLLVVLDFGTTTPFDVLNENWTITESEVDRLALEIGSVVNGVLKILVFEKL